jgi:hypothetical protein
VRNLPIMEFGHKRTNQAIATTTKSQRPLRAVILALDPGKTADEERALELARELANGPLQANVLVVSRSMRAESLPITSRIDWLTLPTLPGPPNNPSSADREALGSTEDPELSDDPVAVGALRGALLAFAPEILVVDRSVAGEQAAIVVLSGEKRSLLFSYAGAHEKLTSRSVSDSVVVPGATSPEAFAQTQDRVQPSAPTSAGSRSPRGPHRHSPSWASA